MVLWLVTLSGPAQQKTLLSSFLLSKQNEQVTSYT